MATIILIGGRDAHLKALIKELLSDRSFWSYDIALLGKSDKTVLCGGDKQPLSFVDIPVEEVIILK